MLPLALSAVFLGEHLLKYFFLLANELSLPCWSQMRPVVQMSKLQRLLHTEGIHQNCNALEC